VEKHPETWWWRVKLNSWSRHPGSCRAVKHHDSHCSVHAPGRVEKTSWMPLAVTDNKTRNKEKSVNNNKKVFLTGCERLYKLTVQGYLSLMTRGWESCRYGNLPALCTRRCMPGSTGLGEMPKLQRGESGLSSDTHPRASGGHLPHLCLLFVSCTVIKP